MGTQNTIDLAGVKLEYFVTTEDVHIYYVFVSSNRLSPAKRKFTLVLCSDANVTFTFHGLISRCYPCV